MRKTGWILASVLATGTFACAEDDDLEVVEGFDDDGGDDGKSDAAWGMAYVGSSIDYDGGPTADSGWADLFASIPNYRQAARDLATVWLTPGPDGTTKLQQVNAALVAAGQPEIPEYELTAEKFRYHMGPVFYRGRLDGSARVLVVGQDAATDEAMVHRAFIGGTGQKVQGFLDQIGITRSYLCLNTFTYSIYGQYNQFAEELATAGPIADHRAEMFEYAYGSSDIRLILSFGAGAHKSVQLWLDAMHGGKLPAKTLWVKMLHPGMAAFAYDPTMPDGPGDPEITKKVMDSFAYGWDRVWRKRASSASWLPPDSDGLKYRKTKYYYANFAIPYRDLPYGAPAELGITGTATERSDNLRVQMHSVNGARYGAPALGLPNTVSRTYSGMELLAGELAWEPPKVEGALRHDPGPGTAFAELMAQTPAASVIAAETGVVPSNDFTKPVWYRGRLDGSARVLVIAQNGSVDSFVAGRTLVGDDGQHIQHLLRRIGAGLDYVAVTPYPYLTGRLAAGELDKLLTSPSLSAFRQRLLHQILATSAIDLVLTFGPQAEAAFAEVAADYSGAWVKMAHPSTAGAYTTWNSALAEIEKLDLVASGAYGRYTSSKFSTSRVGIARQDLPWGKPMWFGTSGSPSQQPDASWIFWNAPRWVSNEPVTPAVP
ncbi:MAG TPA: hypothetical protein VL172_10520 [Kofleriaceae bacterium]|nr:hypothetical protein [Kofleriaceae bacterium]